jgi:surface antigen
MRFTLASLTALALLCVVPRGGYASNWAFLDNAPMTYFTEEDMRMYQDALGQALNEASDGDTRTWSNPATGASGEIRLMRTLHEQDTTCRVTRIRSTARGYTETGNYRVCKQDDGSWTISGAVP